MLVVKPLAVAGDGTSGSPVQQEDCRKTQCLKTHVTASTCKPRAGTNVVFQIRSFRVRPSAAAELYLHQNQQRCLSLCREHAPFCLVIFILSFWKINASQNIIYDCCYLTQIVVLEVYKHTMRWDEQQPIGYFAVVKLYDMWLIPLVAFLFLFQHSFSPFFIIWSMNMKNCPNWNSASSGFLFYNVCMYFDSSDAAC